MDFSLIIPSFIAGILTFLAPCTLPLVPAYLAFISGVSLEELQSSEGAARTKRKIFLNGIFYVVGFSVVFIFLGVLFGLGGSALIQYRLWLSRVGGFFVIFFGLFMLGLFKLPVLNFLNIEKNVRLKGLRPGNPFSSLVFGATFAFGWTPCVGPILGSILTLAAVSATVGQGAVLLGVFSLGLAVPFLTVAATISSASRLLAKLGGVLRYVSTIGGAFLIAIGVLLLTNRFALFISWFYQLFDFINYDRLLDYL